MTPYSDAFDRAIPGMKKLFLEEALQDDPSFRGPALTKGEQLRNLGEKLQYIAKEIQVLAAEDSQAADNLKVLSDRNERLQSDLQAAQQEKIKLSAELEEVRTQSESYQTHYTSLSEITLPKWIHEEPIIKIVDDDAQKYEQLIAVAASYKLALTLDRSDKIFLPVLRNLGTTIFNLCSDPERIEHVRKLINADLAGSYELQNIESGLRLETDSMNYPVSRGFQKVKKANFWPVKNANGLIVQKAEVEGE